MHTSPGVPLTTQCFTDASDDETLGPWIDVRGKQAVTFYLMSSGTTSSGVLSIEEASPKNVATVDNPHVFGATTGSYSLISTVNASDITGGKQIAVHLQIAAYYYVRARISTVIGGGGTVSANCVAY